MPGSISERVRKDVENMEHQVWRALRESGEEAMPYLADDCIMVLMDGTVLDANEEPKPADYLESSNFQPWLSYDMSDIHVAEIDMMAATIIYRAVATRMEGNRKVKHTMVISSTWRQKANAQWYMCSWDYKNLYELHLHMSQFDGRGHCWTRARGEKEADPKWPMD
ncbi:MAG: hypothetical protein M1818_001350 [Claussenomyces sp. TS43310]|nr:MAG: hypothetical protein M1818_001350 [Claussenomyces sp. TS43310]